MLPETLRCTLCVHDMKTDTLLQQRNFEQLADAKRYYRWMVDTFSAWIGSRVLEIGCGQGNITVNLLDKEYVLGIDFDAAYLANIRERFSVQENFRAENRDITKDAAALKTHRFDTIVCINVIEHIEDDVAAAKKMCDILEPGGRVIVLAPAFSFLYSPYDRKVGHYRRYTKATLRTTLESAGFQMKRLYYFNMLGALGWLVVFKFLKRDFAGEGNVSLQEKMVPFLKFIERAISPPFGLSVIAVAQKPL